MKHIIRPLQRRLLPEIVGLRPVGFSELLRPTPIWSTWLKIELLGEVASIGVLDKSGNEPEGVWIPQSEEVAIAGLRTVTHCT